MFHVCHGGIRHWRAADTEPRDRTVLVLGERHDGIRYWIDVFEIALAGLQLFRAGRRLSRSSGIVVVLPSVVGAVGFALVHRNPGHVGDGRLLVCEPAASARHRPALHAAFLVPALAIGIWGQVLPMIWVSAKEGISTLANLNQFASVFDDAIPFLGVQLMMMVVLMVAAAIVLARYFRWRSLASIESFQAGSRAPRLIVNGLMQIMLALCTAVGVILVSTLGLFQMLESPGEEFWIREMMIKVNGYSVAALIPMSGLLVLLIPKLRPAFDMLLDVVNHFYFRPTDVQDALDDDDEFDIGESTFENGALFFSRREALHYRIKRILAHYRDTLDHNPELIIVSHSQGTMVAVEALNDEDLSWLPTRFRTVTLVTMGSPLGHLYQHYFGHCYPPLDQPFWTSLRRRVDRWVNICRIDDFVGTEIDFPDNAHADGMQLQASTDPQAESFFNPPVYSNHAVGPRGHQNYWADREVLQLLKQHLLVRQSAGDRRDAA